MMQGELHHSNGKVETLFSGKLSFFLSVSVENRLLWMHFILKELRNALLICLLIMHEICSLYSFPSHFWNVGVVTFSFTIFAKRTCGIFRTTECSIGRFPDRFDHRVWEGLCRRTKHLWLLQRKNSASCVSGVIYLKRMMMFFFLCTSIRLRLFDLYHYFFLVLTFWYFIKTTLFKCLVTI